MIELGMFVKYLNLEVKFYNRSTAKADCVKIYKSEIEKIKHDFRRVLSRKCLFLIYGLLVRLKGIYL